MDKKSPVKRVLGYFAQGVLLTVPIAVTLYVIYKLLNLIDGIIPFKIPGLGILVLLVGITAIGYFGSTIIAQPFVAYFKRAIDKAPLVKTIYSAISDLVSAFVGKEKRFDQPVLVKMTQNSDLEKPGFITREDLSKLGVGEDKVAVYLPHSYAWSGNMFIVPKESVTPIDASSADVMKFIISGGVATVENE